MSRALLVKIHLYLSAFFAPLVLLVAVSGGLYLIGIKGSVSQTPLTLLVSAGLDLDSPTLEEDVRKLLQSAGADGDFEYLKRSGTTLITRPTSKVHYEIQAPDAGTLSLSRNHPSLQKRLIELHMGHGPSAFKTLQKFFAAGLVLTLLTGLWLGIMSVPLRGRTVGLAGAGLVLALVLALMV